MGWPRKDEPQFKVHWRSERLNALGQAEAACRNTGSYQMRPQFAMDAEQVTCGVCKKRLGKLTNTNEQKGESV